MRIPYRRLLPLLPPLMLALSAMLLVWQDVTLGSSQAGALWYKGAFGVLVAVLLLGLSFRQSRVVFTSIYLTGLFAAIALFPNNSAVTVLLASASVPWMLLAWRHLPEKGVFSTHGYLRAVLITVVVLPLFALPALPSCVILFERILASRWGGLVSGIGLPGLGVFSLVVAGPLMLLPRKSGNPNAGGYCLCVLVAIVIGIRAMASGAAPSPAFTAAALILLWDVLEGSWRHAHLDELTGLPARRAMEHYLACLGSHYVIAMIDIDHFKRVNDRFGHDTGDQVLRYVAAFLQRIKGAEVFRYGGEEFAVIERGAEIEDTVDALESLRSAIHRRPFILRSGDRPGNHSKGRRNRKNETGQDRLRISVSIGVAACCDEYPDPHSVLAAADKALYIAKRGGRNRICTAGSTRRPRRRS